MFFSRPAKILFFTLAVFLIGINITWFWYYGVHNENPEYITQSHHIHGFSYFVTCFQQFPAFDLTVNTYENMLNAIGNFNTVDAVLTAATLGAYYIAKITFYAVKLVAAFLWNIVMIIWWIFTTLGLHNWVVL